MSLGRCRCGNPSRQSGRDCLLCHAKTMRAWRRDNRQTSEQRKKQNARRYALVYLQRGILIKQACWCGELAQMHHADYDKPLEVVWLCRRHHLELHAQSKLRLLTMGNSGDSLISDATKAGDK